MDFEDTELAQLYYDALLDVSKGKTHGSVRARRHVKRLGSPDERFVRYLRESGDGTGNDRDDARIASVVARAA